MKTLITTLILTATLTVAAPQVMYDNGTDTPRITRLPTKSTLTLDGTKRISQIRTEAQANACGYYNIERATPDAGNRIVASDWRKVGNVFVQTITEQISIAEEWAANNQKVAKRVEKEAELVQLLTSPVIGLTVPIQEDDVYTVMDKGSAWVAAGATDAIRVDRLTLLLEVLGAWTKFGDEIYSPWIGRQPTTGDYPQ